MVPAHVPALWTFDDLVQAAGGTADGAPSSAIKGFSIDTRSLAPGEVFVALTDQRDGHDFVGAAFAAGAAAALVETDYERQAGDAALIRVPDPLAALAAIGQAARARLAPEARVVAVTGSAGKTTTKEMLRVAGEAIAPGAVHASERSFNNHWGVPLTLARMPAATRFAVFEIGMNHAGEIAPLVRMVAPQAAIVTTVEAVHLAHFKSVAEIAEAKAEIFEGLVAGGAAIIPADNPHAALLAERAGAHGARVVTFGEAPAADVRVVTADLSASGTTAKVRIGGRPELPLTLAMAGRHNLANALAVVGALSALGLSDPELGSAVAALAEVRPPAGRGTEEWLADKDDATRGILLIDESYNANPASMRAALANLSLAREHSGMSISGRRIAVLGDMLELGSEAPALHADLKEAIDAAGVDLVFASGPNMAHLFEVLSPAKRGAWGPDSGSIAAALLKAVRPGDVVMVKGSNGSRMAVLVDALKRR